MKEELAKFGLNPTEQDVLIFLLRFGSRNAGVIAQKLNLKRPTVYSALENLIKVNLVHKDALGNKFNFRASPPNEIPEILLRNEETRLDKLKFTLELLKRPLETFAKLNKTSLGSFQFEIIESSERYTEFMLQNNCNRNHYAIWDPNVSVYDEPTKQGLEIYFKKTAAVKNHIREILVKGPMTDWYISNLNNKNHICKTIDSKIITTADLTLYEPDQTLISLMIPNSESALLITSLDLFQFFKQVFEQMWRGIK